MDACAKHALLGTYRPPDVPEGTVLWCEHRRCWVPVEYNSTGSIPWPVGRRPGFSKKSLVVYGDLSQALRRESASAVAHWWRVNPTTISRWKRSLGIPQFTEGTRQLKSPRATREYMDAMRARMKAVHPGWAPGGPTWSEAEDEAAMTLPAQEAVALTGRSLMAVYSRRRRLRRAGQLVGRVLGRPAFGQALSLHGLDPHDSDHELFGHGVEGGVPLQPNGPGLGEGNIDCPAAGFGEAVDTRTALRRGSGDG